MTAAPVVIKIGGRLLDDAQSRQAIIGAIASCAQPTIVVHGGGDAVDVLLARLGITTTKIEGLRLTDADAIGPVVGVLAGLVNKQLVASLRLAGCDAVGLCLGDGGALDVVSHANPELGFVGQVVGGAGALWMELLTNGRVPVVASIGIGPDGALLNVNADDAGVGVAMAVDAQTLVLVTDTKGVLDAEGVVIPSLDAATAEALKVSGVIVGGMVPKVRSALEAAERFGAPVRIVHWTDLASALTGASVGTSVLPSTTEHSRRRPMPV